MKQKFLAVTVLVFTVFLGACPVEDTDSDGDASDIDWKNYTAAGEFSIRVKNESNRDLVAFKSSLNQNNLLGGVGKNETDHGFSRNTALFTPGLSEDFSLIFITQEDYQTYKGDLSQLKDRPFTRLFAVYNANGTNEVPFVISDKLGGGNQMIISNLSGYDIELRLDSPRGTTLGYAPRQTTNTILYVQNGNMRYFPVLKAYNGARDQVITIYPKAADGLPKGKSLSFTGNSKVSVNAAEFAEDTEISTGVAFLEVQNSSNDGITVRKGVTDLETATGITILNPGDKRTFKIEMTTLGDGTYAEYETFSGWKIYDGLGARSKDIPTADGEPTGTKLYADYLYRITVTGNWEGTNITLTPPTKVGETKVSITSFMAND
jgi:hypothetical protein